MRRNRSLPIILPLQTVLPMSLLAIFIPSSPKHSSTSIKAALIIDGSRRGLCKSVPSVPSVAIRDLRLAKIPGHPDSEGRPSRSVDTFEKLVAFCINMLTGSTHLHSFSNNQDSVDLERLRLCGGLSEAVGGPLQTTSLFRLTQGGILTFTLFWKREGF